MVALHDKVVFFAFLFVCINIKMNIYINKK